MTRWLSRVLALAITAATVVVFFTHRAVWSALQLSLCTTGGLAVVWWPDIASDYFNGPFKSFSGGTGETAAVILGWLILLMFAGVAAFTVVYAA